MIYGFQIIWFSMTLYAVVPIGKTEACDVNVPCNCCGDGGLSCTLDPNDFCKGPCIDGYRGARCVLKCPEECVSCHQNIGMVPECYKCINGTYGTICDNTCPTCQSCDQDTGVCTACADGYYGQTCANICSHNCLTRGCDLGSGRCINCRHGHFGEFCNQTCTSNCLDGSCARETGECYACIDGYYGETCTKTCYENCKHNACDKTSGICIDCIQGMFGVNCTETCPSTCNNSLCHRNLGTCKHGCVENFTGDKCQQCSPRKYGDDCSLDCPSNCKDGHCNRTDGTCIYGCITGYSDLRFCCANSPNCEFCSSKVDCAFCKNGTYGQHCENECPVNCDGPCNKTTGNCDRCKLNTYGLKCEYTCSETCLNPSSNSSRCNRDNNGTCTFGCKTGYYGEKCEYLCSENCNSSCQRESGQCNSCKYNRFGSTCEYNCSSACLRKDNDIVCGQFGGQCLHGCDHGFYGNMCEFPCSEYCNGSCYQESGECHSCKSSRFGKFCGQPCSKGCYILADNMTTVCSRDVGECLHDCLQGLHGKHCNMSCSSGCQNNTCNRTTGYCSNKCTEGLTGLFCDKVTATVTKSENLNTTIIAVIVGLILTLIVLVVIVFIFISKRHSKQDKHVVDVAKNTKKDSKDIKTTSDNKRTPITVTGSPEKPVQAPTTLIKDETKDDNVYVNVVCPALKINRSELFKFLSKTDDTYKTEFATLPQGLIKPYTHSKLPPNTSRNRYNMVYPYDESRVKIQNEESDYINASYINGYNKNKAYIACLGPTTKTLGDFRLFWKMIWQEKVETIVMVTKLKEKSGMKCDQYWPNAGKTQVYGDVEVKCTSEVQYSEYTVRNMSLSRNNELRQFRHIHFTTWPDKGVPSDVISIVNLRNKVNSTRGKLDGPLLVHCSAGIGRTGTYIALDYLIRQGFAEETVDVLACVNNLRQQRVYMVQTVEQYKYLHHALLWALSTDTEPYETERFCDIVWIDEPKVLPQMLEQLQTETWYHDKEENAAVAANKAISFVNRAGADIPGSRHAVTVFTSLAQGHMRPEYINAVYIDSVRRPNAFIAAQTPLSATVTQFLDMIVQRKIRCIIDLEPYSDDQDVGEYIPEDIQEEVEHNKNIFKCTHKIVYDTYVKRELTLTEDGQVSDPKTITHYQFTKWLKTMLVPDAEEFVQFIHDVEKLVILTEQTDQMLVHCLNGAARSALFCAAWLLIERIGIDQRASVMNTLRQVKSRRRTAIPNEEQIKFCFKSVGTHLKLLESNVYTNTASLH